MSIEKDKARNLALAPIVDNPHLPRVLLIGDSISVWYTLTTRKLLKGICNLHRPPASCSHTARTLRFIEEWLGDGKWDVIHFNFGLHDLKYTIAPDSGTLTAKGETGGFQKRSIEQYSRDLEAIILRLKCTSAILIWATTTPVPDGSRGRYNVDVIRYNSAASKVIEKYGIMVNDLYAFVSEQAIEMQPEENVHFTAKGSILLAGQVADSIKKVLEKEKVHVS